MSSALGMELDTDFEGCYSMMLANWCHEFVVANRYILLSHINSERYGYVKCIMRLPQTPYNLSCVYLKHPVLKQCSPRSWTGWSESPESCASGKSDEECSTRNTRWLAHRRLGQSTSELSFHSSWWVPLVAKSHWRNRIARTARKPGSSLSYWDIPRSPQIVGDHRGLWWRAN